MSAAAGSGHPTSAMSAADLLAVLVDGYLRYDFSEPKSPANDRLVFSKGHASTLLYAIYRAAGVVSDDEILDYRKLGSMLEGHPTPLIPWVDVATGSLGQGLPIGVGMALAAKQLERLPTRVWVLCGDSEMAEGSMWEAFEHAAHFELDNLTAIIDVNRLGQRGETMVGWNLDAYLARAEAFGWNAIEVDGHDVEAIDDAFGRAVSTTGRPTVVVARTMKGKGVAAVENQNGWHGKPLDDPGRGDRRARRPAQHPRRGREARRIDAPARGAGSPLELPRYELGTEVATRKAYGDALAALGAARPDVVVARRRGLELDVRRDLREGTSRAVLRDVHRRAADGRRRCRAAGGRLAPVRFDLRRVPLAGVRLRPHGGDQPCDLLAVRARTPASRSVRTVPSQMALEDIASLRAVHGSTVLHPCDANQTARLVAAMAETDGISYLRTLRPATPVLYPPDEEFEIGGSRVLRSSDEDEVAIIAAGITVHEALKAADALAEEGIAARVIDLYSIKPLDAETLLAAAEATDGRLVTVEDHWPEGGLGDAVLEVVADTDEPPRVVKLAVREMPRSGTPAECLAAAGIDAEHIASAARKLVAQTVRAG